MRTLPLRLLLIFAALFASVANANDNTADSPKLYVVVETFEPIAFENLRQGRKESGDLVLGTLRNTATASAEFAQLPDQVVILNEKENAPENAPVLRLTWTDGRGTVAAELIENGKKYNLGIVSREPLLSHPDYNRLKRQLDMAAMQADARHDAVVRTETEMNLYAALKAVANRRARIAAGK